VQKRWANLHRLMAIAILGICSDCAGGGGQSPLNPALNVTKWLSWPPNDGCDGKEITATLQPGRRIDRYGSENGSFFATPATPYAARSLPYDPAKLPYTVYVVQKPLAVEECRTAAWFDEPGGGTQFKAAEPAAQLKSEGVIVIAPQ